MYRHPNTSLTVRRGFTLIELLVTIAILLVVAVIVIPSVRMMNKDRKVHDTARIVGSMFSAARERASVDGRAGIEIVPINSNTDSGGFPTYNIPNMGTLIYQLRSVPPWPGDTWDSRARVVGPVGTSAIKNETYYDVTLVGANAVDAEVRANDFVEFNQSGIHYRITEDFSPVTANTFTIAVDGINGTPTPPAVPSPPLGIFISFHVVRQPVRIESSVVRLPRNLFLNLSWSGFGVAGKQFGLTNPLALVTDPSNPAYNVPVKIWFNRDGSIDRAFNRDGVEMQRVDGPLYLLMSTGEGDEIDVTDLGAQRFIEDDDNLWIVVDNRNGGVTLGAIAELGTDPDPVTASRALAKNRRSTTP